MAGALRLQDVIEKKRIGALDTMLNPSALRLGGDFLPGIGDVLAAMDATKYANEGEYGNAALAGVGMLPFVPNMAGMLVGRGSKSKAVHEALDKAEEMKAAGKSDYEVSRETLSHQDKYGNWKHEVPDNDYVTEGNPSRYFNIDGQVKDYVKHPEVLEGYPEIGEAAYRRATGERYGSYDPKTGTIFARGNSHLDRRSTTAHEMQHAIQDIEGWEPGGNRSMFPEDVILPDGQIISNQEAYERLLGEVEARTVQKRLNYTPEQRKLVPFNMDFDKEYNDILYRFGTKWK